MKETDTNAFSEQKKKFTERMKEAKKNENASLILVIVANTLDSEIGKGCREDIKSIRHMFEKMSEHMKFNFLELLVAGADYNKENVYEAIDLLTPGNNDIIIFYYSGHGFSFEKEHDKRYPQVDLRPHKASDKIEEFRQNTHNLRELFEMVKGRGARLNIVIGDCCNNLIKFKRNFKGGDDSIRTAERPPVLINQEMCEALFCNHAASILIASADKGEYAITDDEIGSIFTFNFTNSLKILMNKSLDKGQGLPWKDLLEETKEKTHSLSKKYDRGDGQPGNQKAIFEIESVTSSY